MNDPDVLTGEPREEANQQVEDQTQQAGSGEGGEGQSETTSQNTEERHVPLAALEAERTGRKDWKEKALRFEGELKAVREQLTQRNQPAQEDQTERNPFEVMQERIVNERFNTSEMIARQAHADIDEKVEVFKAAMEKNPALYAQMQADRHPWEFAYREGARMLLAQEMGDDPSAYKSKLEAEIEARILAKHGLTSGATSQTAPKTALPASLAGARSSAARTAPSFTGPTPFDQVVNT
jgi:hypothetical protein